MFLNNFFLLLFKKVSKQSAQNQQKKSPSLKEVDKHVRGSPPSSHSLAMQQTNDHIEQAKKHPGVRRIGVFQL